MENTETSSLLERTEIQMAEKDEKIEVLTRYAQELEDRLLEMNDVNVDN